jgi:flagellar hook-basal body complex protein FliE
MDVSLSKAASAYKLASAMGAKGGVDGGDVVGINEAPLKPAFDAMVAEGLEQARGTGYKTEAISTEALANKTELHELIGAITNADLTLETVVAIRDKMINAYQEIVRMPI